MPVETQQRTKAIAQFRAHDRDTGSAPVQIALLTQRINGLTGHFKTHKKDVHSRQGLLMMVSRRRRLLEYLKRHDEASYRKVLDELNLRK
jgi:small subunit ribosomal protein S15